MANDEIQDPAVRGALTEISSLTSKLTDLLKEFIPVVISDLKVINERTCRIEEQLKITKRHTDLIPKIHSLLEDDGIEIASITSRIKKLEN